MKHEHIVKNVCPDSIAQELGIEPGDCLLSVNGNEIEDVFDYHFYVNDEYLTILIRKPCGEEWELEIEKDYEEDLGIEFEQGLMDEYRSCRNKCMFCFIDQMPEGMRDTLYFKDDDSRLSFLQGNYVTLTNMKDRDIERIIMYRLAPINISVHTMDPQLRCRMLNNRFAGKALQRLRQLYEAGIEMNGQIVLCKGINDGENLDETQNRTHQILKIAAEDVSFLHDLDADLSVLKTFQGYAGIKDRQQLLSWQLKYTVNRDILEILRHMTVHKFLYYMNKQYELLQFRKTPHKTQRYSSMQDLVSEYRDYLEICEKLDYDLKNSFVLYPKDLQKSHDKAARRIKHKADAKTKREFIAICKSISEQLCFEKDGLKLICPSVPDDVIAEGHALHHCVGDYINRVVKKECIILFVRN